MFPAASRAFTGPGQIVVVGLADPLTDAPDRIGVVVTVVGLESADTVVAGSGGGRAVWTAPMATGGQVSVFDAKAPPPRGAGLLSVRYQARLVLPGAPEPPPSSAGVYHWRTGAWRTLPPRARQHGTERRRYV